MGQQLNPRQQRWLEIARYALQANRMQDADINWLAETHNVVLEVVHNNHPYVLRLTPSEKSDMDWLESEALWLQTLASNGLIVPFPVTLLLIESDAEFKTTDIAPVIKGILFDHVAGKSPEPETVTPETIEKIGGYLGRMHTVSERGKPPSHFSRPKLDFDGLFGKKGIYHPGTAADIFSHTQTEIMQAVIDRVKETLKTIGKTPQTFGIIHGDLLLKNALIYKGDVRAIDFEYSGRGYFLYDLMPLLWQLKAYPNYTERRDALWRGYCAVRPSMKAYEKYIETLIAARQVASMRWLAQNQTNPAYAGKVPAMLEHRAQELAGFMVSGVLERTNS